MKTMTWKLEYRNGSITLTKDGESFAAFTDKPGRKFHELTDLRDLLNAQQEVR